MKNPMSSLTEKNLEITGQVKSSQEECMMATVIRVLYVDDESDLLEISKLFLEESGDFTVTTAISADEGIRLLEQEKFDAIISDYQMPVTDGIQFLVEVRKRFGPIPFILFTGRGREEVVIQAINSGADFYLQKGGEPGAQFAELTHKIKAAASSKRADDALRKSEEKYRHLIEHSNEAIVVAQDGMLKLVNHKTIEFTGYSEQELLSMKFSAFIHADDRAMVVERYQKRMKGEEGPSRYAFRLSSKDGSTRWVELSVVVIDWDGRPATLNFLTDITERKRADDSLIEEQHFSKLILDSLPGIFYLYTYPENRLISWNKQHETLLGYTAEEIKGKLGTDLHLPEHKDAVLKAIDEVMEKGQSSIESTLLAKDGRLIPFFFTGVRFEAPGQLYFMGIGIDITERKRAEEALLKNTEELHASYEELTASEEELRQNINDLSRTEQELRESEDKFRVIADYTVNWESWFGADGKYIWVSPSVARFTGYTQAEILAMPDFISTVIAKEDRTMFTERFREAIHGISGENFEFRYLDRNGTKNWLSVSWQPIVDMNGNSFGTRASGHDITGRKRAEEALKESEERFRLTLDATNDGIWDWDIPTGTAFFSPRWYTMLGYAPDEMPGSYATWRSLIHPDDIGPAEQIIQNHAERRDGGYRVEFRMRTKDGSWKWILTRGQVVEWDADNKPVRMVGTHTDITERKRKEEALRINENRLQMTQEIGHIGCWEYDIKTNQMWGSEEGCHLFGYPRMAGSFPIENFASCITEPELVLKAFNDLINEGKEYDLDFVINPKDGSAQKTLHSIGTLEKDEQGNPVKVKGINHDITERKMAEEALRESEERYRAIYDQSPIAIELYDATGALVHVNPACLNLFGIADIQAIQNFSLFTDPNITDERKEKLHKKETVHYEGPFDFEKVKTLDLYPTNRDGIIWLDVVITPLGNPADPIAGFLVQIQDITKRKQAERELASSHVQLKEAHRLAHIGTWDWVIDTDTVTWSEELCNIAGWDPSLPAPTYAELPNIYTPASWDLLSNAVTRALTTGEPYNLELEMLRPDGSMRWTNAFGAVKRDTNGKVIGFHGTVQDITERQRAKEALRESEEKYRALFAAESDGIFVVDKETGTIIDCNDAITPMYGYRKDEVIGQPNTVMSAEPEATRAATQEFKGLIPIRYHKRMDGSVFPVEITANVVSVKGRDLIVAAVRDITNKKGVQDALQTSELQYRRLFETAQDGILILDEETGTIIDANTFLIEMLGYPLEYFVGKHLWEVGFIKDKTLAQDAFTELKTNGYIRYEDLPLETIDGRSIDVEFISNVYPVNHHKIIQCNIRDITARKRAEDALVLSIKKISLLSSITRHDINNQMTVLLGYINLLQKKQPDPSISDYIQKIATAAQRISSMIQFTKEYESIGVKAPAWQDCRTLVDTAAKQVTLGKINVKNDLPAGQEIFSDPLVEKVFYNLMDNAARYGGKITNIRFSVEEHDDDRVVVCEDDGDGVVAEEKEKIFERGFGKNTGLGLALSREILDITGIAIKETGEPGKGARFEMTVPKGAWRMTGKDT